MQEPASAKSFFSHPASILSGLCFLFAFALSAHMRGYDDVVYAPALIILILSAALALLPALRKTGTMILPASLPSLLILSFWSYLGLSLSWSTVPYTSLLSFSIFCALPLTYFALVLSPVRKEIIKDAALFLGAAFTALSVYALWQYYVPSAADPECGLRACLPLANPNNLAALLNLALLPALAFALHTRDKRMFALWAMLSVLLFAGMLATGSRGAFAAFLISALVLAVFARKVSAFSLARLATISALFVAAFTLMTLTDPQGDLSHRFGSLLSPLHDAALIDRLAIWQATLSMIRDHLWTGTGFGTFYLYYPAYRAPMIDGSTGFWAHMDPLQFWAEAGFAAPLLFYATLLAIAFRMRHALRALPEDSKIRAPLWASFAALLSLALHSHLTFNFYIMAILMMAGFLLAAFTILSNKALGEGLVALPKQSHRALILLMFFASGLFIGAQAIKSAAGSYMLEQARMHKRHQDIQPFLKALAESDRLAPRSNIDAEVELAAFHIQTMKLYNSFEITHDRAAIVEQTKVLLDTAQAWNPAWAQIDYLRGSLAIEEGDKLGAAKHWQQALAKNPQHFEARRDLGDFYISQGKVDLAYEVMQGGLRYPHSRAAAAWYRARMKGLQQLIQLRNNALEQYESRTP